MAPFVDRRSRVVVVLALLWGATTWADEPASKEAATPAAGGALQTAAPELPDEIVAALREGRFDEAITALGGLRDQAGTAEERAYLDFLASIADRLAGREDAARDRLRAALEAHPRSVWVAKIRQELAMLELAGGDAARAEELARTQATALLADDRKDRLADVYESFAHRLLTPDDPVTPADPAGAWELLAQARTLAKGATLRARLLFAMGQTSRKLDNNDRAIAEFQEYLHDYPEGADRVAVRFALGDAQRALGRNLDARLTWTDLARDIEHGKPDDATAADQEIRARALAEIPSTHGMPTPGNDAELNLGVAAVKRFLAAYPSHPRAVRAAFDIGAAYLILGKTDQALEAFDRFLKREDFTAETEEARKDLAELSMAATHSRGQLLQAQGKYNEAIAAWKGYLATFPNGPQSAQAQRAILDTQLLIAADHYERERYAEARAAWTDFAAQNPLDPRVPEALFRIGESHLKEKRFDQAVAAWATLSGKFPETEPTAHAQFLIGAHLETEKGDLAGAIEQFKKIGVDPWRAEALQRIAVMESKALTVVTPRAFRSGETPHLKIASRNLEQLTFTAHKLNAEAYFRKKLQTGRVESLDIGLVAPDAEWTVDVPGFAKFKPVESNYELKNLELPGVYVVKVTDQKTLQATSLVISSDIDAIVKTSRDQVLVFAQDPKTGKGRPGARVLFADNERVFFEGQTGDDGVLLHDWSPPRDGGNPLNYLLVDGPHVAGSGLTVAEGVSQGLTPRAYIHTDRPAYRPGQKVSIRGVVREVQNGQYANTPGATYRFEAIDAKGRRIIARDVVLSEFGAFHESVALDSSAPVGAYRVRVFQPGKSEFAGEFNVQAYQLEPIALSFDLKKTVFYRGEIVEADIEARHQYGAPVARRPISVALPDGRTVSGETDAAGKYHVSFPTDGFSEEQTLQIVAQLPEDNVRAAASISLAVRGFSITANTDRRVYLSGETFVARVQTADALGEPIAEALTASLVKLINERGRLIEREIEKTSFKTDATGKGEVRFRADDPKGGNHLVRIAGTDRFGNPIIGELALVISGDEDATRLRILADRTRYKVGEEARVNLHSRGAGGAALLTWEADRVLSYKIVPLAEGDNPVVWTVDGPQFPNFTLSAARMREDRLDSARLDLNIERDLRVTLAPVKPTVGPGEAIELEVTTVDQLGRPVSAEVSIAMVDQSLLRLFGDTQTPIGAFFYNQTRSGAFATSSTNTFKYEPATVPVVQAVAEEAERLGVISADADGGQGQPGQAPARRRDSPASARAPAPGMGGMMGAGMMMGRSGESEGGIQRRLQEVDVFDSAAGERSEFAKEIQREQREFAPIKNFFSDVPNMPGEKLGDAQAPPRERFVETAYWNPGVVTDKEGKARVAFQAPGALSEYRIMAKGTTGADTLVGQTTATVRVRKDFFVDLKVPAALVKGDKPRFIARVHHLGVEGTVALRLSVYTGGREEVLPRTIEIKGDGVEEALFEPVEAADGDVVRLTLSASVGDRSDELVAEVPVRPWGLLATASASGTSNDGATVFVGLPKGRTYEDPEMRIVVSPTLERMIVELALGRDFVIFERSGNARWYPPPTDTTIDRAADLLGATSALEYLRRIRPEGSPDHERLVDRIQGLVAELTSARLDDGGWAWVGSPATGDANPPSSDRLATAAAFWALASAERLGLLTDPSVCDQAGAWLVQAMTGGTDARDLDARAALLHALSARNLASFEMANSLNRERQNLSSAALAHLALTFANMGRPELAGEALAILGPRAKTEAAAPGRRPRLYWEGSNQSAGNFGAVETTALVCLAYARTRGDAPELPPAIEWLEAHRVGMGWNPHKAKGAALASLAAYHGRAGAADDRYALTITVNEEKVAEIQVAGAAEGQSFIVPTRALKPGGENRVNFALEGRGTFGYSVSMTGFTSDFGPDQTIEGRPARVTRRVYQPAPPELDGKTLPVGFGVAPGAPTFENAATGTSLGGKARVSLSVLRNIKPGAAEWDRDFLVVEERLPAGTTLIDGSVQTSASSFTLTDGMLTFYFPPDRNPGEIWYDVYGYLPGAYRTLPAIVRSAYEPGRFHVGEPGAFRVFAPGEPNDDPYRPTPDELYARGKALFDAGKLAPAGEALEALFGDYPLRDDVAKDAARMLLLIHIDAYDARKIVRYFEVVKEKSPEQIITFDQLKTIGRAYRDINEHERALIVWRGLIEAGYVEDARVGELLRQRGRTLEALAYLTDLWRQYPNTPPIEADFFGLSQVVADAAARAADDPALRRELAAAGVSRTDLLRQAAGMIRVFLTESPNNPMADEAGLALIGALLELEDYPGVAREAALGAAIHPKSALRDGFQYAEALADFHLGRYDRAVEIAEAIAGAVRKDAAGADQPSPNKWRALYILGQIYDARRMTAKALEYYRQVADRFTDAAGAIEFHTRKALKIPEVSVVRPGGADEKPGVKLDHRNVAKADVTVYPVDLMRLYLTRRNLNQIADVDLAGITPLVEKTVELGSEADYEDKSQTIDLPLDKEGAYLVMIRGDELYASGIILVSTIESEVLEETLAGRARVVVRDARSQAAVPKAQVKVIGSDNAEFISGETDLRGVFTAEGLNGRVSVVVRKGTAEYAFYRGTAPLGAPATPALNAVDRKPGETPMDKSQSLDADLKLQNQSNSSRQLRRLEERYQQNAPEQPPGAAAGEFR